jgi:hypothetical protein
MKFVIQERTGAMALYTGADWCQGTLFRSARVLGLASNHCSQVSSTSFSVLCRSQVKIWACKPAVFLRVFSWLPSVLVEIFQHIKITPILTSHYVLSNLSLFILTFSAVLTWAVMLTAC